MSLSVSRCERLLVEDVLPPAFHQTDASPPIGICGIDQAAVGYRSNIEETYPDSGSGDDTRVRHVAFDVPSCRNCRSGMFSSRRRGVMRACPVSTGGAYASCESRPRCGSIRDKRQPHSRGLQLADTTEPEIRLEASERLSCSWGTWQKSPYSPFVGPFVGTPSASR